MYKLSLSNMSFSNEEFIIKLYHSIILNMVWVNYVKPRMLYRRHIKRHFLTTNVKH